MMNDKDAYVGDAASNAVSKPRSMSAAATRTMAFANDILVSGQVASVTTATMATAQPSTRSPAAAALARASRQGKGGSSISHGDKSNAGNAMDDSKDDSKD
jgi:hypothetical protein